MSKCMEPSESMSHEELLEVARWLYGEVSRLDSVIAELECDKADLLGKIGTIDFFKEENRTLRDLIMGAKFCADDDADAKDCPLYDEDEPYRCKRERLMAEVGIGD